MAKARKVRDIETGIEYNSLFAAGKELSHLVNKDPDDSNFVWYEIVAEYPDRFEVQSYEDPEKWISPKEGQAETKARNDARKAEKNKALTGAVVEDLKKELMESLMEEILAKYELVERADQQAQEEAQDEEMAEILEVA